MMTLTQAIEYLRSLGLYDEAIARLANVNTTTVWRARNGGTTMHDKAIRIIEAAERKRAEAAESSHDRP